MDPSFQTRAYAPDDFESLIDLRALLFGEAYIHAGIWSEAWNGRSVSLAVTSDTIECVEMDGMLVGFTQYKMFDNSIHLEFLALSPDFQNRKIGSALVQRFKGMSFRNRMPLKICVFASHPRPVTFFERHGFRVTSTTDRLVRMQWDLLAAK